MNKGINLLGSEHRGVVPTNFRKIKLLRIVAASILFGVAGLSIILFLLIALSPLPSLQNQEKQALTKLSAYHTDIAQLTLINDRIKNSRLILSKRTDYNKPLSTIISDMGADTNIMGLVVKKKEISVTVASNSLPALDSFLMNLMEDSQEKKDFTKIIMSKFFYSDTNGMFNMTVDIQTL